MDAHALLKKIIFSSMLVGFIIGLIFGIVIF